MKFSRVNYTVLLLTNNCWPGCLDWHTLFDIILRFHSIPL